MGKCCSPLSVEYSAYYTSGVKEGLPLGRHGRKKCIGKYRGSITHTLTIFDISPNYREYALRKHPPFSEGMESQDARINE